MRSVSRDSYRVQEARSAPEERMWIGDRYELAAELATRYWKWSRRERGAILERFCPATVYHCKYAMVVLRGRKRRAARRQVPRVRR
ncbi:MAG: hypothetical protein ACREN1_06070 [Candidatus Dormibacteria bacterium]